MNNTTLNNIENITNRAYPNNPTNNTTYWHMTATAGAGGLKSCLTDMIKYVQAQLNASNSIPIENAFLSCQTPEIQINGNDYFGLGWEFYFTASNKRITVKDGGTGGFTAFIAFDKTSQKALIALFNNSTDNSPSTPFVNLLNEYFK
jgi:CubicO group peptidase (beta-lactamase class C family)